MKQFPYERWVGERAGTLVCNSSILIENAASGSLFLSFKTQVRALRRLLRHAFVRTTSIEPKMFEPIVMPQPARDPRAVLPDAYYSSVAYAAQNIFQRFALDLATRLFQSTKCENLCVAGGCGLNIDANAAFITKAGFKNLFVQPASSDCGIPLGAALWGMHAVLQQPRDWEMKSAALGRSYTTAEIETALDAFKDKIEVRKSNRICEEAAQLLADGKIIGWFQGGSEYGPRALGHRSILSDARQPEAKDILNERVKHREIWRPFAASVLEEKMTDIFDINVPSPFMLIAANVNENKKSVIPSLVHKDGTCRLQSVTEVSNKKYYDLIKAFDALTGVPVILNTSFNLGGDPIVETPHDAIDTFTRTDMDHLVIEDFIITKRSV